MSDTDTQETATENVEATATVDTIGDADQVTETVGATAEQETAGEITETEADKVETFDRAYVEKLRRNEQKLRAKAKEDAEKAAQSAAEAAEKALTERLGKALGLIQDDKPVDPKELLKQAEERAAQIAAERDEIASKLRAHNLEKALANAANTVDGDLDILTPYLRGTGALDALDPDAEDYAAQVAAVVASAVEANPKLRKATPVVAPARSGGDLSGGTASPRIKNPTDIDGWRKKLFGDSN